MRLQPWLGLSLALPALLSVGCIGTDASEPGVDTADHQELRMLLLCQQGLSDRTTGWDKGLFALCEDAEAAGLELIRDGSYPAFGALDGEGAYRALFAALDENHDGRVNGADRRSAVHLAGFSWGGVGVAYLADRLWHDQRIASSRRTVMAMVLLDPYQPFTSLTIPYNVSNAWIYRQTETTAGDCSTTASLGQGFNGLMPIVESDVAFCTHYDVDAFIGPVGHCGVPTAAHDAALENLTKRRDFEPWASHAHDCPMW